MKAVIFLSIFLSLIFTIHAQTITWSKVIDLSSFEVAHTIKEINDGGYLLIGISQIDIFWDVCLCKLNEYGDTVWFKNYRDTIGSNYNKYDIEFGIDSGFVFYKSKFINWDSMPLLVIWTNSLGDSIRSKEYYLYSYTLMPMDIDRTSDSCFIIVGDAIYGNHHCFVVKIGATGDSLWSDIKYSCPEQSYSSVVEGKDKSFLIGLEHYHINEKSVEKLDSLGNSVGILCSLGGFVQDIEMLADSNFVYTTYSLYPTAKITGDLDTIWTRPRIVCNDIAPCSDGGFVVTGTNNNDLFLTKYNTDGDSLWTVTYGGGGVDIGRCVEQTADGGFIICGSTTSYGTGSSDFYIIKTDSLGYAMGVEEEPDPEIVNNDDVIVENISQGIIRISFVSTPGDAPALKLFDISGREVQFNYNVSSDAVRTYLWIKALHRGVCFFKIEIDERVLQGKFSVF